VSDSPELRLEKKLWTLGALESAARVWREANRRIVTTNGCFDVLHWGHIRSLLEARAMGDVLVCGVNSDRAVKLLKGPKRPLFPENVRLRQLAALECVDVAVVFDEETPTRFLEIVRPHVHVKGADYLGKTIPELSVMERWGGEVRFAELVEGVSTSHILEDAGY